MDKNFKTLELDVILNKLADECTCEDAKEMALALKPDSDMAGVELLLSQTEDAFSLLARFGAPSFSGLKNVNNPLHRAAAGGSLNPSELLDIGYCLRSMRALNDWYGHCSGIRTKLDVFFEGVTVNKYLENKIFSCIISPEEISDKASEELSNIRKKIRIKENSIREKLDAMIHSSHYQQYLQEAIVTQRNGRFVVPVKAEHRSSIPGLVHDTSSTGATVFVEPSTVVEANNDIKVLQGRERDEIMRILFELSAEAGEFAEAIKHSFDSAVMLNLIFAKAHLAYKMKASKPILNNEGVIYLKKARHPLIDPKKVVPTDIALGIEYDTLVITGPNTGGKTVSLKTLGLLTAMTMCGLLIPVSDMSRISVFDKILVDIGDEQSIAQSLSTFSSHMVNIIDIMNKADGKTLALIDELGAGTDPIEGAALAVSIIEDLRQKGAVIAATTHYAELKAYALETEGVSNGCCEFDVETLRPTYRLLIGVPGRSNAFAISQHLGMDEKVVENAKNIVGSDNRSFEAVLEKLEQSRQALEDERKIAEEMTAKAKRIEAKAKEEKDKIETLKKRELDKAKKEAEKLIESAKRKSGEFLLELEKLKKEQNESNATEIARKTRRAVKSQMGEMEDLINPAQLAENWDYDYKLPRELVTGDRVVIRNIGEGEVVEVDKNKLLVKSGMLKTRVKLSDVVLLDKPKEKSKSTPRHNVYRTSSRADADVKTEIDLRGETVDEAIGELSLFIDKCVLNNIEEIRIIHGKGTGALRSAVTDYLRTHPNISEYRLGKYGEGENGVTIAKVK
ncbi:MAG: endonuclease MutS2 [Acetobacter sp.]|nr:endonuclease MutS2 [Bacteroides sp.]MCM1341522.1 endonuclease MutS2 [Acetobacter sp.]MCM1433690.1 endonuclease MutS2 [Clostridiales bacterium]